MKTITLSERNVQLRSLALFRAVLDDAVVAALCRYLDAAENAPTAEAVSRYAAFVSAVACVFPKEYEVHIPDAVRAEKNGLAGFVVRGECRGTILREGRGCDGFGYDPLFYVAEKGCTFAELPAEEKNAISHRGKAIAKLAEKLKNI